jgi:hypothetical protein
MGQEQTFVAPDCFEVIGGRPDRLDTGTKRTELQ